MKALSNLAFPLADTWALYVSAEPYVFEKQQKQSPAGVPVWVVTVSGRVGNTRRTLWVQIPLAQAPDIPVDTQVRLVGLTLTYWSVQERSGVTLRAAGLADENNHLLAGGEA